MLRKINNNVLRLKKNNEKLPNVLRRFYDKPRNYEGGISITAEPGLIIPRVHRDAPVICPCNWSSEPYLDDNGRSRIDAAFGLAVGPIDGVIRIEAGEEKIPIYNYLDINDIAVGIKYYKSLEIFLGSDDQEQSEFIKKHLGDTDTPYYRGLAYFVLKGIKLWKWPNKGVPVLRAVILRNVAEFSADEYDPLSFGIDITIDAKNVCGFDNKIFWTGNINKAGYYDLVTQTYETIDSFGFLVPFQLGLTVMNGTLYGASNTGVYSYDGDGTWTQEFSFNCFGIDTNTAGNLMIIANTSGTDEIRTWDGTTVTGYGNLGAGANPLSPRLLNLSDEIYAVDNTPVSRGIATYIGPPSTPPYAVGDNFLTTPNVFIYDEANEFFYCTTAGTAQIRLVRGTRPVQTVVIDEILTEDVSVIGSPVSCYGIVKFSNSIHVAISNKGTDGGHIYRLEEDESFTKLDRPDGLPGTDISVRALTVYENRLYAATNKGIWRQ